MRRFMVEDVRHHERMLDVLAAAWPGRANAKRRAALGHAADFFAWRSLRRQGLSNDEAVEQMIGFVANVR
jgi:hypothetical protein